MMKGGHKPYIARGLRGMPSWDKLGINKPKMVHSRVCFESEQERALPLDPPLLCFQTKASQKTVSKMMRNCTVSVQFFRLCPRVE